MRPKRKVLASLLLAAVCATPVITGCAVHARVYGPGEDVYYTQWEHETHREHVDYARRNAGDQKAYWKWRDGHENQH